MIYLQGPNKTIYNHFHPESSYDRSQGQADNANYVRFHIRYKCNRILNTKRRMHEDFVGLTTGLQQLNSIDKKVYLNLKHVFH